MKETELIKKYFLPISKNFGPSLNLEDDAAILKNFYKENFVISVDNFIQGIHCPSSLDPKLTILRAIYCATSDLAAMGAMPYCMFLSLAIPRKKSNNFFFKISQGIKEATKTVGIELAGGDLNSYNGPFSICVTVIGKKRKNDKALFRNGSKVGDFIGVTGTIGDAFIGLKVLEKKVKISEEKHQKALINSFLFP
ncbi:thiamine-phosphate kinase, partial [Alphaproteobacteria bacterium]|nr:thiamine-phosphate kinase [Alphaproteobacteria bacterium]